MNKKPRKLRKLDKSTLAVMYVGQERYSRIDNAARDITELTKRDVRAGDVLRFLIDEYLDVGVSDMKKELQRR